MDELKEIASSDDAAIWAHQILGTKNSLTEADARAVEEAFQAKLATFEEVDGAPSPATPSASQVLRSGPARSPGTAPLLLALIRVGLPIQSHGAFVTRTTSSPWPNGPA